MFVKYCDDTTQNDKHDKHILIFPHAIKLNGHVFTFFKDVDGY